jgi:hypothetical protein
VAMRARTWVTVLCIAVLLLCGFQIYRAIDRYRYPGGHCSAADDRFTLRLASDVMATKAPDGMTTVSTNRFQPCEGDGGHSTYYGGVTVAWAYPAVPRSSAVIQDFYRTLGQASGWTIAAALNEMKLPGCKVIDGTAVDFLLATRDDDKIDGRPVYWVDLSYDRLHGHRRCE